MTMTETRPGVDPNVADNELRITRTFNAPAARVFDLWADAEKRVKWWGPASFTCLSFEHDFREGGAWKALNRHDTGKESGAGGVYRTIETNKRIVFTFRWTAPENAFDSVVSVTLAERGGKTVQTFHQTGFRSADSRNQHVGGWSQFFDTENAFLEGEAK